MSPSRRKLLKKPLNEWSDQEILDVVAKVSLAKTKGEALLIIEQHMSEGTYRRAKRRVGLRKPKVKSEAKAPKIKTVHEAIIELGDALCGFFNDFARAVKAER